LTGTTVITSRVPCDRNQCPINFLPHETLRHIFEYLEFEPGWETVCTRWLYFITSLPTEYASWDGIVVSLDAPVLPSVIEAYLAAAAGEKRLEVFLVSRSLKDPTKRAPTSQAECCRVETAMKVLVPHFGRFKTLSIPNVLSLRRARCRRAHQRSGKRRCSTARGPRDRFARRGHDHTRAIRLIQMPMALRPQLGRADLCRLRQW